ncbi:hypothetical protein GE09DRAFT_1136855 [Coniochaeta sp. 2T2.1]|nr:hypothetical protein GE09DRAFT_1136855 [Coniochaeta sp. 2T2.1]
MSPLSQSVALSTLAFIHFVHIFPSITGSIPGRHPASHKSRCVWWEGMGTIHRRYSSDLAYASGPGPYSRRTRLRSISKDHVKERRNLLPSTDIGIDIDDEPAAGAIPFHPEMNTILTLFSDYSTRTSSSMVMLVGLPDCPGRS